MNHMRHRGEDRYFLIISNGRTGSTWLLTSLDQIPDVTARHELKWPDGTPMRSDAQYVLDPGENVRHAIDAVCAEKTRPVKGSKLVFNPYTFHGESVFAALSDNIDRGTATILLKRRYLETWLSWKARGVYHELNEAYQGDDFSTNSMVRAMLALQKPRNIHLVLCHDGETLAPQQEGARYYPLETAIDDLLQFFSNDMQALGIVKARKGMVVDYSSVKTSLPAVARYIGTKSAPSVVESSLSQPLTKKLDPLEEYLHPLEVLAEIADALDELFADVVMGSAAPKDILQWDGQDKLVIWDQNVAETIGKYGFETTGDKLTWEVRKPVVGVNGLLPEHTSALQRRLWRILRGAKTRILSATPARAAVTARSQRGKLRA